MVPGFRQGNVNYDINYVNSLLHFMRCTYNCSRSLTVLSTHSLACPKPTESLNYPQCDAGFPLSCVLCSCGSPHSSDHIKRNETGLDPEILSAKVLGNDKPFNFCKLFKYIILITKIWKHTVMLKENSTPGL